MDIRELEKQVLEWQKKTGLKILDVESNAKNDYFELCKKFTTLSTNSDKCKLKVDFLLDVIKIMCESLGDKGLQIIEQINVAEKAEKDLDNKQLQ